MAERDRDIIEAESEDVPETSLAVPDSPPAPAGGALVLSAGGGMLPSVDEMGPMLAEYDKRRGFIIGWIEEHFQEGTHFGVPPGCEPRGQANEKQWRHKPSLYDAGARLFLDLFGLRPTYESDMGVWEMSGKKPGMFCRKCRLLRADGAVAGEGTGIFRVGEKRGMQEGSAEKMADKRARVAAVLDAVPFARAMFTQDLEDLGSPAERLMASVTEQRADHEESLSTAHFMGAVCAPSPKKKPKPTRDDYIARLHELVPTFRKGETEVSDSDWLEIVIGRETGLLHLAELDIPQLARVGKAIKAGVYDPVEGDRLPEGEG